MIETLMPPPYVFTRGQRSIFAEVFFPKKTEYQSEIFRALQYGLHEKEVKEYLQRNIGRLVREMRAYPFLFDPLQYERKTLPENQRVYLAQARRRVEVYRSHFKGWSMYEVDGMFWNSRRHRLDEERTQVIRLIFRFESKWRRAALQFDCYDVLESIRRWILAEHFRLDHVLSWSEAEKNHFLDLHGKKWPRRKRLFVERYYEKVAKEVKQWIDDTGLFVFGFLVRKFWEEVQRLGRREDEIWVVSFFTMNLNVVRRMSRQTSSKKRRKQ